jgi:hypothetical protein
MTSLELGDAALGEAFQEKSKDTGVLGTEFVDRAKHPLKTLGQILAGQMRRRKYGDSPRTVFSRRVIELGPANQVGVAAGRRRATSIRANPQRIGTVAGHQARLASLFTLQFADLRTRPRDEMRAGGSFPLDQAQGIMTSTRLPEGVGFASSRATEAGMLGQFSERFVVTLLSQSFANLYSGLDAAKPFGNPHLEGPAETRARNFIRLDIGMTTRNHGQDVAFQKRNETLPGEFIRIEAGQKVGELNAAYGARSRPKGAPKRSRIHGSTPVQIDPSRPAAYSRLGWEVGSRLARSRIRRSANGRAMRAR